MMGRQSTVQAQRFYQLPYAKEQGKGSAKQGN